MSTYKIGKNKKRTISAKELKSQKRERIQALVDILKKDGVVFRDIVSVVKTKGYKIGYNTLFKMYEDEKNG